MLKKKEFNLTDLLAPAVLVLEYIFFSIFGTNFLSPDYLVNILDGSYYIGFMAIGVTFVIITGGIDLSIGTNMMCAALLGGYAYTVWLWPMWQSLMFAVFVATVVGILNGLMIAYMDMPPFIATLGTQMMIMGFGAILTKVQTMRYPTFGTPEGIFKNIFYKTVGGFPIGIIWLAGFFVIAYILLNHTRFGRYTFAIGSNRESARLSGIKIKPWLTTVYAFCGFCSGLAAIFYAAVYTSIIPSTGNGQELLGIAGVVIGGTSMSGGVGTLRGTMLGVFIMSVLKQGLMSMGLQSHYQTFFTGLVVIGAVWFDQRTLKRGKLG